MLPSVHVRKLLDSHTWSEEFTDVKRTYEKDKIY